MSLPPDANIWERIRKGQFPITDASILEVVCSVGRQLGYRLEVLIETLQRGAEPDMEAPLSGPGGAYTPITRMVELMRLDLASHPRDHQLRTVTNAGGSKIMSNTTTYSIPILVTNQDNAQKLYYGSATATITNAPIIEPESSLKIILSPNSDLYGIVVGADITVSVSNLDLPMV